MKNQGCDPGLLAQMRDFLKSPFGRATYLSDQAQELPQPPLTKPPMGGPQTLLPRELEAAVTQGDYLTLLHQRRSFRNFLAAPITLSQLGFLLWTTQGITGVRGNHYAYFRPVPSAGARHPFETYLTVHRVEGLEPGLYHYLPEPHALERIAPAPEDFARKVSHLLCDQRWSERAGVVFFYAGVLYRGEWRYGTSAQRVMLLDAGHVMQNLYLSCHATGLGACAIAAFRQADTDAFFGLDGQEECMLYTAVVGRIPESERAVTRTYP